MKATLRLFCFLGMCLLVPQFGLAQGVATGDLHVTVKDPKGNVVTNATITVRDVARGLERAGSGDGQGGYSVRQLPPGTYTVTVDAAGFSGVQATNVNITVGEVAELPISLSVAAGKEVVEVNAQAEMVETSRSSSTDTIGERRIDNLPINGRNYIQFTLTDSQLQRDNAPSLGGAAPTSGLSMSGQRARSNLVNVDGADATDNSTNGVRSTVSQEDVQEFQIITNNYAAEYGRAAGGVVNIITRSGSNDFHGDVYGYLRNRNFQAVNPFSTTSNPAYTRVQAGTAFGGALKKDKTFYFFSFETTRRHETGFSSVAPVAALSNLSDASTASLAYYGLENFDTSQTAGGLLPLGLGTIPITPPQATFLQSLTPAEITALGGPTVIGNYAVLAASSSGMAVTGAWPYQFTGGVPFGGFPTTAGICAPAPVCPVPASYQALGPQGGNFPVFEVTNTYSLRLDHNLSNNNRLTLSVHVSPSTVTGVEVSGQDQPFGQNTYSRTSQTTFRDVTGIAQDTWTLGTNKVNELRFQYARRGLAYFYNRAIAAGSDPGVNVTGFAYVGREPYSYIQRTEQRYQVTDNFSWTVGRHSTKFGGDFNYLPLNAIFTVNYGGVYDFSSAAPFPAPFPVLNPVQAYGAGLPVDLIQGVGNPTDSFRNIPIGAYWQDSWRIRPTLTLNYGVRYDVEIAPTLRPLQGLAIPAYNTLGIQKGIQTDKNNVQPRIGIAWDPHGDGKTVVRASYGMFYDHPLLGLYFLGDASDGSSSGQLAILGTGPCSNPTGAGNPANLNAIPIFQGLPINSTSGVCSVSTNPLVASLLGFSPNQQRFNCDAGDKNCGVATTSQSIFLNQNYLNLNPSAPTFLPTAFQPFGYPQGKNFVYAYSQQVNLTVERDLGSGYAFSLAYNFNGGRHLNRPINANTIRGDVMTANFLAASEDAALNPIPGRTAPTSPFTVSGCNLPGDPVPYVDAALANFFRPGGLNPSIAAGYQLSGLANCVAQTEAFIGTIPGFNATCNPNPANGFSYTGCVPFSDMDANYSNGSSVYHGLTANLRKRFSNHYEFLASYTWSHAIDDSTDLQATLVPQDSYIPNADRSTSLFDQRHRFVFSGVYQSGKLSGSGFVSKFFSDWTFAPQIEMGSGRPFNIITGNTDNLQFSPLTGRPNTFVNPACTAQGNIPVQSKYSPTGVFQEPCILNWNGQIGLSGLASIDGNFGRNGGLTPWTVFNDVRFSKRVYFNERLNMDLIADMFNIANVYNVAAVNPLCCSPNTSSPTQSTAGQATAAYDPRQFQFALKLNW